MVEKPIIDQSKRLCQSSLTFPVPPSPTRTSLKDGGGGGGGGGFACACKAIFGANDMQLSEEQ